jgi:hypothetical protein
MLAGLLLHGMSTWAWAMVKGVRDMGYDMVITSTDMVHLDVQRIRQLLDGKMNAVWHGLDSSPRTCPSNKTRLCTYQAWCFWKFQSQMILTMLLTCCRRSRLHSYTG